MKDILYAFFSTRRQHAIHIQRQKHSWFRSEHSTFWTMGDRQARKARHHSPYSERCEENHRGSEHAERPKDIRQFSERLFPLFATIPYPNRMDSKQLHSWNWFTFSCIKEVMLWCRSARRVQEAFPPPRATSPVADGPTFRLRANEVTTSCRSLPGPRARGVFS